MSPSPERVFDVIGLGCVAVDELLYVPAYPPVDQKTRVLRTDRQCGGLTGNALVAGARLGAKCAFAGCLGTDWLSDYVVADFAREGVDTTHAPRLAEGRVVHSVIVVGRDQGSRNIFYEIDGLLGAHPSLPESEVLKQARVLLIDDYGMSGNLRAAKLARAEGIGVVADFEVGGEDVFKEVMDLVDHLVLSEAAALRFSGAADAQTAARELWRPDRQAVVITCGREGCWTVDATDPTSPVHYPAFLVDAVNTTGCGDVFHGAYAVALARGMEFPDRIRFASAAAACKAAHAAAPSDAELANFLQHAKTFPSKP